MRFLQIQLTTTSSKTTDVRVRVCVLCKFPAHKHVSRMLGIAALSVDCLTCFWCWPTIWRSAVHSTPTRSDILKSCPSSKLFTGFLCVGSKQMACSLDKFVQMAGPHETLLVCRPLKMCSSQLPDITPQVRLSLTTILLGRSIAPDDAIERLSA